MRTRYQAWTCAAALLAAGAVARADEESMGGGGSPPAPAPSSAPAPAPVAAPAPTEDVLTLKDGTEVRGRITAEDDAGYAVKVGGSLRVVEKGNVTSVKRGAPAAPSAPEAPPAAGAAPARKDGKMRRKDGAKDAMPEAPAAPLTEEGKAWAKTCIERLLGADPAVQRSAAEALRALGTAALPVLKEARETADDAGKQRLERVAGMLGKTPSAPEGGKAPPGGPMRGAGVLEKVKADLALDDAQSRTVGAALLTLGRETREVLEDARDGLITYEDARTKVSGLRSKLREDLSTSLTAEQLTKLDGILDEMGRRMGGAGPGKGEKKGEKKDGAPPAPPEPAR